MSLQRIVQRNYGFPNIHWVAQYSMLGLGYSLCRVIPIAEESAMSEREPFAAFSHMQIMEIRIYVYGTRVK